MCPRCAQYRTDPEVVQGKQLRFVDLRLKRKRNRLKVGYNFLATLPEAICGDSDCEQTSEDDKDATPRSNLRALSRPRLMTSTTPLQSLQWHQSPQSHQIRSDQVNLPPPQNLNNLESSNVFQQILKLPLFPFLNTSAGAWSRSFVRT